MLQCLDLDIIRSNHCDLLVSCFERCIGEVFDMFVASFNIQVSHGHKVSKIQPKVFLFSIENS
jgi:hypothetical protein